MSEINTLTCTEQTCELADHGGNDHLFSRLQLLSAQPLQLINDTPVTVDFTFTWSTSSNYPEVLDDIVTFSLTATSEGTPETTPSAQIIADGWNLARLQTSSLTYSLPAGEQSRLDFIWAHRPYNYFQALRFRDARVDYNWAINAHGADPEPEPEAEPSPTPTPVPSPTPTPVPEPDPLPGEEPGSDTVDPTPSPVPADPPDQDLPEATASGDTAPETPAYPQDNDGTSTDAEAQQATTSAQQTPDDTTSTSNQSEQTPTQTADQPAVTPSPTPSSVPSAQTAQEQPSATAETSHQNQQTSTRSSDEKQTSTSSQQSTTVTNNNYYYTQPSAQPQASSNSNPAIKATPAPIKSSNATSPKAVVSFTSDHASDHQETVTTAPVQSSSLSSAKELITDESIPASPTPQVLGARTGTSDSLSWAWWCTGIGVVLLLGICWWWIIIKRKKEDDEVEMKN